MQAISLSRSFHPCKILLTRDPPEIVSESHLFSVSLVANAHGGAPGSTRHYMINVRKLEAAAKTGDMGVTGDIRVVRRVTSMSQTGDTDVTQSVMYTSRDPSVNNARARVCVY